MIKLNTIYRSNKQSFGNNDYYIVIIRNPKAKYYEIHCSVFFSYLEDFKYLLKECDPYYVFYTLSDARYYARQIIDGKGVLN